MAELYRPKEREEIEPNLGQVGDVVQSMLTEAQFQALRGSGWVLMDGADVTGSTYADITGNTTLPDARGRFLRARDYGPGANPDGDQAEGTTNNHKTGQPTATPFGTTTAGNHWHNQVANAEGPNSGGSWDGSEGVYLAQRGSLADSYYRLVGRSESPTVGRGSTEGNHGHGVDGGDNETAPVNLIVNVFIKIN